MRLYLAIAIGSGIGGLLRFRVTEVALRSAGTSVPWGTLAVNIFGSLLIGWLAGMSRLKRPLFIRRDVRALLMIGFCGGLTTFSFFSLQVIRLEQSAGVAGAGLYVVVSVILGIAGAWAGFAAAVRRAGVSLDD